MSGPVRIGVLRLVDSAPIVVAERRGIFRTLGIDVRVQVEPSWSNLADKLSYGLLQAAVLLPPLAMAATLGAMPMQEVVWHEHGDIVARIVAGDARGAETAAREHTEADGGNARREWLARLATGR
ncbi:MAG: ABC transporter substrate-binding protein [Rhodospirillales bacterium]|nr:ABC transporter substrate-binding protein [Rhodospirillales bacterium]